MNQTTLRKFLLSKQNELCNIITELADFLTDDSIDATTKRELNLEIKSAQKELNLIRDIIQICVDRKYY